MFASRQQEINLASLEQLARASEADSWCLAVDGRLCSEYYREGFAADRPVPMMSCTKSIASLVVGIMVDQGLLATADRVSQYIPSWRVGLRGQVTIKHLLTQTSGIVDQRDEVGLPCAALNKQSTQDLNKYVESLEPVVEPGSRFEYCNSATQLLGAVIERRLGEMGWSLQQFARQKLFNPLGISGSAQFHEDAKGQASTYADLQLCPADALKIGQLVCQTGRWKNTRIVSEEWISESTRDQGHGYGYLWWPLRGPSAVTALGWLNTNLYIFPGSRLVAFRSQLREPHKFSSAGLSRESVLGVSNWMAENHEAVLRYLNQLNTVQLRRAGK